MVHADWNFRICGDIKVVVPKNGIVRNSLTWKVEYYLDRVGVMVAPAVASFTALPDK